MSRSSSRAKVTDHRHRKTEQEEDAELLQDEQDEEEQAVVRESPSCIPVSNLPELMSSHQRRRHARLPNPRSKLAHFALRKWHQRYSCRRNGTWKNASNHLL